MWLVCWNACQDTIIPWRSTLLCTVWCTDRNHTGVIHEIVVSISYTGHGIDSEILPRLFTKFATKSTTGTGLGLFISKSIIDAHAGKIWGKNNYPEGKGVRLDLVYLCIIRDLKYSSITYNLKTIMM